VDYLVVVVAAAAAVVVVVVQRGIDSNSHCNPWSYLVSADLNLR